MIETNAFVLLNFIWKMEGGRVKGIKMREMKARTVKRRKTERPFNFKITFLFPNLNKCDDNTHNEDCPQCHRMVSVSFPSILIGFSHSIVTRLVTFVFNDGYVVGGVDHYANHRAQDFKAHAYMCVYVYM